MKRKILILISACMMLSGCGFVQDENGSGIESHESAATADISQNKTDEAMENVRTYTKEEDEASARYLQETYGVVNNRPRVILDCDMTYMGDDSMCMCLLAQADSLGLIDLLGVTITGGNSFVAVGTNAALTQLEKIGREDIPVYMGTDEPVMGYRNLEQQEEIVGKIEHWGAMYHLDNYIEPSQYHNLGNYYERAWGYSVTEPESKSSVDFMLETARMYPGEVIIISTGAPTNIALACQQDDSFAANIKEIIYTGTILEGPGTYTPYADFNCFYDSAAFHICFKSNFQKQTVVPHDAAKDAVLNKAVFDMINDKNNTLASHMWIENQYSLYRRTVTYKSNCLDAIAAVSFLIPSCVSDSENYYVAVNYDEESPEYGRVTVSDVLGENTSFHEITFITAINTEMYWNFATDLLGHMKEKAEKGYLDYL